MSDLKSNDEIFSKIMQKGKLQMPFSDFEDKVMYSIKSEIKAKAVISKNIKLSILFFILGIVVGLRLSDFVSQLLSSALDISKENADLLFQFVYVLVILTQLDMIVRFIRQKRA